jgi:hypothetical protein
VLNWRDVTPETIVYENSKHNKHNGLTVPVKWRDPETGNLHPLVIQTPIMSLPFGISDKTLEQYGRKVEASLSFPTYSPHVGEDGQVTPAWDNDEMLAFFEWMSMWDKLNPDAVAENTETFFRKKISRVVVDELYKPNIKPSTQPDKYAPTVRCKVPCSSDGPTADFWAVQQKGNTPVEMSQIRNGSRVIALLKTTGLWFAGKSFGMNFHVIQMVQLASDKFEGCAIAVPPEHLPASVPGFTLSTPPCEEAVTEGNTFDKKRPAEGLTSALPKRQMLVAAAS